MNITNLKQEIRTTNANPSYNPLEWKNYKEGSCYVYAINMHINEFLLIGNIIGKQADEKSSDEELIEVLQEEIRFLGAKIQLTTEDSKVEKNEYKICLIRDPRTGYYHFFRQDNNFLWSHKFPQEFPERVDYNGEDSFYYKSFSKRWYFKIRIQ